MLWITIALLVIMVVSVLLDLVDLSSDGNRYASIAVRGLGLFVCFISLVDFLNK